jgi:hypothetical protein
VVNGSSYKSPDFGAGAIIRHAPPRASNTGSTALRPALFPPPASHRSTFAAPWLRNQSQSQPHVGQVHSNAPPECPQALYQMLLHCFFRNWRHLLAPTHLWTKKVELIPESDKACLEWQWDVDAERWGQSENSGADPVWCVAGALRSSPGTLKQIKTPSNKSTCFDDASTI